MREVTIANTLARARRLICHVQASKAMFFFGNFVPYSSDTRYLPPSFMNQNVILWIYIALLEIGGTVGFIKAGSKASIIASSVFAIPLILCALGILDIKIGQGFLAFLVIFFGMRYGKGRKLMPNGVMALASLIASIALYLVLHRGA